MKKVISTLSFCAAAFVAAVAPVLRGAGAPRQSVTVVPATPVAIHAVRETVRWNVTAASQPAPAEVSYALKKNGLAVYQSGILDLGSGPVEISTSLDEPGAVLLEVTVRAAGEATESGNGSQSGLVSRHLAGALVAPERIRPSSERPRDFDAFWEANLARLHAVPANVHVTPGDSGVDGVEYATVRMDNIGGTHVQGQLAKPKRPGKYPALLILQWAGVYPLEKSWVTTRAAEGWLVCNVQAHDLEPVAPADFYRGKLKEYWKLGAENRETSYFLRMYLGDVRAAEFLAGHPDWDGHTLVVMGTSMGGQQSFAAAALCPKVTALLACVPSSCDVTGPAHGRAAGYPDWARTARDNPAILETGRYFDPVNFAPRVQVPALVAIGFIDETCPPAGVWSAVNQVKGPVEVVPMVDSPHQDNPRGVQRAWQTRSAEWLQTLVNGGPAPVKAQHVAGSPAARATEPILGPR